MARRAALVLLFALQVASTAACQWLLSDRGSAGSGEGPSDGAGGDPGDGGDAGSRTDGAVTTLGTFASLGGVAIVPVGQSGEAVYWAATLDAGPDANPRGLWTRSADGGPPQRVRALDGLPEDLVPHAAGVAYLQGKLDSCNQEVHYTDTGADRNGAVLCVKVGICSALRLGGLGDTFAISGRTSANGLVTSFQAGGGGPATAGALLNQAGNGEPFGAVAVGGPGAIFVVDRFSTTVVHATGDAGAPVVPGPHPMQQVTDVASDGVRVWWVSGGGFVNAFKLPSGPLMTVEKRGSLKRIALHDEAA